MLNVRCAIVLLLSMGFTASASAQKGGVKEGSIPKEKKDLLTLRYKPQVGTLLYDVKTKVDQHIHSGADDLFGTLGSSAQLAFHNVSIDYKKGLWAFDRYFTAFHIVGRQLTGDSLYLKETYAVNKITRVTYQMTGDEVSSQIIDTLQLQNTEAQTNFYFFQPPRMLIPLPAKAVTYGDSWSEHSFDSIHVHDTINIGVTNGVYHYNVYRLYHLAKLMDTLQQYLAVIVATDSGYFDGSQNNTVTGVDVKSHGPITGFDTTFLDLFSGRVVRRTSRMQIPTAVEVSGNPPFTDLMEVRSVVVLNESNALKLRQQEDDQNGSSHP